MKSTAASIKWKAVRAFRCFWPYSDQAGYLGRALLMVHPYPQYRLGCPLRPGRLPTMPWWVRRTLAPLFACRPLPSSPSPWQPLSLISGLFGPSARKIQVNKRGFEPAVLSQRNVQSRRQRVKFCHGRNWWPVPCCALNLTSRLKQTRPSSQLTLGNQHAKKSASISGPLRPCCECPPGSVPVKATTKDDAKRNLPPHT